MQKKGKTSLFIGHLILQRRNLREREKRKPALRVAGKKNKRNSRTRLKSYDKLTIRIESEKIEKLLLPQLGRDPRRGKQSICLECASNSMESTI